MNVTIENAGPCRRILRVRAEASDVSSDYDDLLKSYSSYARVPGFRPGKAPAAVVEKHYAKNILEDAKEKLVPRVYRRAVEQEGLEPVAVVDLQDVAFTKDTGLDFNVTIDIRPDFKVPKYRKISVKAEAVTVEETRVDEVINDMRTRFARFEDVERDTVQENDLVKVDYAATLDGVPLSEAIEGDVAHLASRKDFWVHVGDPEFLPGINAGLAGAVLNTSRDIEVTFPDAYAVDALKSRTVVFAMTPTAIRERVLPELNSEFVKQFGDDIESVESLREKIRESLQAQAESEEKSRQKGEISKFLLEKTTLELPQSIVDEETRLTARSIVDNVVRSGATREQIASQQQTILDTASRTSTDRVKLGYILSKIAKEENIVVDADEINGTITAMAARYQRQDRELRQELEENGGMERIEQDLLADKTLDFLLEQAKIK